MYLELKNKGYRWSSKENQSLLQRSREGEYYADLIVEKLLLKPKQSKVSKGQILITAKYVKCVLFGKKSKKEKYLAAKNKSAPWAAQK
jgi:hypothetical protein